MATWDGSFQGGPSEDEYYYLYSNPQNSSFDRRNWNYYNQSPALADNNTLASSQNPNQPENGYQNHVNTSTIDNSTSLPSNSTIFFDNNRQPLNLPSFHCQSEHSKERQKNSNSTVVSQSKLHPGASEFIPSSVNSSDSSKKKFPDNRNKYNNRKYDNKRNTTGHYRQYGNEYPKNSFKNSDKSRKNTIPNNPYYSHSGDYEDAQDYLNSVENLEDELVNNITPKDTPTRGSHNNGRARSHGNFQNDRYSNNRQYNMPNDSSSNYQCTSSRARNTSSNLPEPSNSRKHSKNRQKNRETRSEDPRDEKFRKNALLSNNEGIDEDKHRRDKKKPGSRDPAYSEDPRDERYRGRRDYREEKMPYKEKRSNYQDYNEYRGNYERDLKSEKFKEDNKHKESSRIQEEKSTNWRQKTPNAVPIKRSTKKVEIDDAASQKERLSDQLNRGRLECLVCCDYIRQNDSIWSCNNCYHVLHLKCIKKWAQSSQSETGWRCPACQNVNLIIPEDYFCFCGKSRDPEWNRQDIAHSCGEICGRARAKNNCVHKCTLLCHPGSCPLCTAMVTRSCGCGRMSQSLKCSTDTRLTCDKTCDKLLNCKFHKCERKCHHDDCGLCSKTIQQECYCGKHTREVPCLENTPSTYTCEEVCNKLLECENHNCKEICHEGPCNSCSLKPEIITHCCCGQTPLSIKRESCLDPIPTCEKICSKRLRCGQPSNPHTCKASCHEYDCPQCDLTTWVKCRCGNMDREIPCTDLKTKADDARCEKKCTKKRSCGKHKCNQLCCIDIEHICPLPCSKTLSCGRHKCELTCHKGRCQPCYRSSFDELYCECGAAVIYPPVACGTRKPTCSRPCSRQHSCGHEVLHNCHSEPTCPPCTVLTQKWCYGKHELRKAVPCYFNEISCGMPCGKPISCGRHKCITLCHPGPCEKSGQICVQPCTTSREMCGHICAAPCHDGKCPDTPCKEMVKVTCICGHRSMTRACADNSREYQRIASGILASKMADMQLGHSVDLDEVFGQGAKKQNQLKTLECNDECKTIERNRKLALGLQIVNPDFSGKLLPRYNDYMKQFAKKDANFCQMVHDKLTELVQLAKTSKQKSRSYSFDSMNRDKRQFVHEACEHFGCESQAYDQEPKRNVVATAVKDKCWLPSYSLLEMVRRENGQRKVPRPMLNTAKTNTLTSRVSEVLPSTAKKSQKLQPSSSSSRSPEQEIDYFDYPMSK